MLINIVVVVAGSRLKHTTIHNRLTQLWWVFENSELRYEIAIDCRLQIDTRQETDCDWLREKKSAFCSVFFCAHKIVFKLAMMFFSTSNPFFISDTQQYSLRPW
jgi:hypothetical protein